MSKKGENIYKRKDGRWEARYIKGYSPEGRARYGYCYGRTYYEAKNKAGQARAALLHHQPLPGRDRKKRFAACCDEWLQLKRSSIRESTYVKYETIIEKHIKPGLGGCFTDMISELLVEQFSYELLRRERLAPKTVRDILSLLRSILKYTERQFIGCAGNDVICALVSFYNSFLERNCMMEAAGVTEELKARDSMRWVGLMNTLKAQAEEVILAELILD